MFLNNPQIISKAVLEKAQADPDRADTIGDEVDCWFPDDNNEPTKLTGFIVGYAMRVGMSAVTPDVAFPVAGTDFFVVVDAINAVVMQKDGMTPDMLEKIKRCYMAGISDGHIVAMAFQDKEVQIKDGIDEENLAGPPEKHPPGFSHSQAHMDRSGVYAGKPAAAPKPTPKLQLVASNVPAAAPASPSVPDFSAGPNETPHAPTTDG